MLRFLLDHTLQDRLYQIVWMSHATTCSVNCQLQIVTTLLTAHLVMIYEIKPLSCCRLPSFIAFERTELFATFACYGSASLLRPVSILQPFWYHLQYSILLLHSYKTISCLIVVEESSEWQYSFITLIIQLTWSMLVSWSRTASLPYMTFTSNIR